MDCLIKWNSCSLTFSFQFLRSFTLNLDIIYVSLESFPQKCQIHESIILQACQTQRSSVTWRPKDKEEVEQDVIVKTKLCSELQSWLRPGMCILVVHTSSSCNRDKFVPSSDKSTSEDLRMVSIGDLGLLHKLCRRLFIILTPSQSYLFVPWDEWRSQFWLTSK